MAELVGVLFYLHEKNLPLYTVTTVVSVILMGLVASGLSSGVLAAVDSVRGRRSKGEGQ